MMIESINKNTDVVGVSDALKQLATRKQSPVLKQNRIDDEPCIDGKVTINPSIDDPSLGCENEIASDEPSQTCGWWHFRPRCLRHFMNPQYALTFLCLAGAIQGNYGPLFS
jgi:hypothetical protein